MTGILASLVVMMTVDLRVAVLVFLFDLTPPLTPTSFYEADEHIDIEIIEALVNK